MHKFAISALIAVFMIPMSSLAKEPKKTASEVEQGYGDKYKKGFYYYDDPEKIEQLEPSGVQQQHAAEPAASKANSPKSAEAILQEILKESRKQTLLQEKILKVLKDAFDPEPVVLRREDGTTCVANSSADCFMMPITAEAKKVPVIANLLKNQTMDNAAAAQEWLAVYISKITDIGSAWQFSIAQNGTKAYPLGFQRPTFDSTTGAYSIIKEKHRAKLLQKTKDVQFEIFLGDNVDLDIYAMDNIAAILSYLPESKFKLIFKNDASFRIFNEGAKTFLNFAKAIKKGNFSTKTSPEQFKLSNIQTTPTFSVQYTKNGKKMSTPIGVGRIEPTQFVDLAIQLLEFEGLIARTDSVDYTSWKDTGNYSQEYLGHQYGIKLDKEKIRSFYGN